MSRGQVVGDELERLALLIEVVLQPPALEAGASIGDDRDDVLRLDHDVALGRVANDDVGARAWRRGSGTVAEHGRGRRALGRQRRRLACRRVERRLGRRLDEERLVAVQHQEREKDGNEDASFHESICSSSRGYRGERPSTVLGARVPGSDSTRDLGERFIGTGSCPAAQNGWQRARRLAASQLPRTAPYRRTASRA